MLRFAFFKGLMDQHQSKKANFSHRLWALAVLEYYEYKEKKYVIAYSHPETRVADCLLFYGIVDSVQEIYSH